MALSTSSIALSGIQAGFRRLHTASDNIARRPVANSEKNRVNQYEQKHGGVKTEIQKVELDENAKVEDTAFSLESMNASNIDYAEQSMEKTVATIATQASFAVFDTSKDMDEQILDLTV